MSPLSPHYNRPYAVRHCAARFFTIRMGNQYEMVHVKRLKPFTATDANSPAKTRLPSNNANAGNCRSTSKRCKLQFWVASLLCSRQTNANWGYTATM